jgi:hypothetical protein
MNEDVESEVYAGFPERTQLGRIERQILQFGGDNRAGESELDGAAFQLGRGFSELEGRDMRKADEAAGMRLLCLAQAIVDQPADGDVRLIETAAAGEHAGVDSGQIHHADMRCEITQERIEQITRIPLAIEIDREFARIALEQFRRRVVLLKVDEHWNSAKGECERSRITFLSPCGRGWRV